jgi:sigma-E factor negative regulatory protein RseC
MIEEYAIVTAVRDDQASLILERRTACGLCGQKRGCGNATWSKMVKSQPHEFTAHNAIHAQVGDAVVVGMDEHAILRSVWFLYVVPMLALILGALLADHLFANQFYVMLGAALGLLSGFYAARYWAMGKGANGLAKSHGYQAHILRQAEDGPLEHCGSAPN